MADHDIADEPSGDFGEGYIGQEKTLWRGRPSLRLAIRYWLVGGVVVFALSGQFMAELMSLYVVNKVADFAGFFAPDLKNFLSIYISAKLGLQLISIWIPLAIPLWNTLQLLFTEYEITNQRLVRRYGVFSRSIHMVELFRIRDLFVELPFTQRILGLGVVRVFSTDHTLPQLPLIGQTQPELIANRLRKLVRVNKTKAGVRVLESVDVGGSHM